MHAITAELLTIGDELLYGQIVDTNAQWMGAVLSDAGIKVLRKSTVGDVEEQILQAFADAEARVDIVLITGGLGPTSDDLTKPCLAKYFDCPIEINEDALREVTQFFKSRGRELTELNRQQAALPVCCEMISNPIGTAPGMWFARNGKVFVSMPGVPHEMKRMMEHVVVPRLKQVFKPPVIIHQVIRTVGIGESFLAGKISSWEQSLPSHIKLAYLPSLGEVKLRLTGSGTDETAVKEEVAALIQQLLPLAGEYIYGYGNEPLEAAIGNTLGSKGLSIAIAESCTGGYLSHLITSVPGSSAYFMGTIIPYSYDLKMRQLGVRPETLEKYGAVSEPTVTEMANLVRAKFSTDIGVATSGIAGPGGATPEKPVGTVWIAYSDKMQTTARKLQLSQDRMINIKLSAVAVLNLIRQGLMNR